MKKNFKIYFRFIGVLLLCGLAYFNANSFMLTDAAYVDNTIEETSNSSSLSSLEVSNFASYNEFNYYIDNNLLFEIVDPQEVEEFESLHNANIQSCNFETNFSRIQHLKNSSYMLKERSMRFTYNSTKPSSELVVRLQVFII